MPDFSQAFDDATEKTGGGREIVASDDFAKFVSQQKRERIDSDSKRLGPIKPFEPRCHVCTHHYRDFIDTLLTRGGLSYTKIAQTVPPARNGRKLDHRQISTHAKKHLGVGEAAIVAILEEEARDARQDFETSVRGAITHRGALEVALRKAYEDIVNGVSSVEPRDMIAIGKLLREWDAQTADAQVEVYRAQVHAIQEAIQEIVPREYWPDLAKRARAILDRDELGELPAPLPVSNEAEPETVEAEVVA